MEFPSIASSGKSIDHPIELDTVPVKPIDHSRITEPMDHVTHSVKPIEQMTDTSFTFSTIPPESMKRFIASQKTLEEELRVWKNSEAGRFAIMHKLLGKSEHPTDAKMTLKEQIRRFFLTKLVIEDAQRRNPHAEFSIDSPFTLLTEVEAAEFDGGVVHPKHQKSNAFTKKVTMRELERTDGISRHPIPLEKDWMKSGCIPPIKYQGKCGACWAFASINALESAYCLKGNPLTAFSVQQLTSCSRENNGCKGGTVYGALTHVKNEGGICLDKDYRYTQVWWPWTKRCKKKCKLSDVAIKHIAVVERTDEALLEAVNIQPVAVGIASGNKGFMQYKRGILSHCKYEQTNHDVLVIGFGSDAKTGQPYYKILNSWGRLWGENGYGRLKRGVEGEGVCGVFRNSPLYPVMA